MADLAPGVREGPEARGVRVVHADLGNLDALRHAGIDRAGILVITLTDDVLKGTDNCHLARSLRALNPDATIIASASRPAEVAPLYEAGADHVYMWSEETAAGLLPAIQAALHGRLSAFISRRMRIRGSLADRRELLE